MKTRVLSIIAPVLIAIWALSSCIRISLQTSDSTSDKAPVSFKIDWNGIDAPSRPDSVKIAMNQTLDAVRYFYTVDSEGAFPDTTARMASFGNYLILAFTTEGEDYTVSGLEGYPENVTVSMRDFLATVKDLPTEELNAMRDDSSLDFNASYRFIRTPSSPLYAATLRESVSDTKANEYGLVMTPLLLSATFRVGIAAEDGVSVDKVVAEVSGVPASVSILSGETSLEDIARVIFLMSAGENGEYEATVLVPGLYPSENTKLTSGPGIFRLALTATKDGVTKVLRPAINIGDIITSASIMQTVSSSGGQKLSRTSAEIEIPGPLTVDGESFTSGSLGEGVEGWFDSGSVDVEI